MSRPGLKHRPLSIAAASKTIVLITGGNTGIGYEILKKLAENPTYQVLMGTRIISEGEEAVASLGAPINVNPIQLDVTDDTSIEHCFLAIQQFFGKLDVLIHTSGTTGRDLSKETSLRQIYDHIFSINVTSSAVLTERLSPLLEHSTLARVIFVSSDMGSIQSNLESGTSIPVPYSTSSKAALNSLSVYYSNKYPNWKVNAVSPGARTTSLHENPELSTEIDSKNGAIKVTELAVAGPEGVTGKFLSMDD